MKGIMIEKPNVLKIVDLPMPELSETNDVLVKIRSTGICGSDVGIYHGTNATATYPRIIGHEVVGIVEEVMPGVTRVKPGNRVIIDEVTSCGHCWPCLHGRGNVCDNLRVRGVHIDGGYREYVTVPAADCYLVPEGLSDADAVMIEPMTIAVQSCSRARLQPDDTLLLLGCGALGSSILKVARHSGARIIVADVVDEKLQEALQNGADAAVNTRREDLTEAVRALTDGHGSTVSIDAAGLPDSLMSLLQATGNAGRIVTMGFSNNPSPVTQFLITAKEMDIMGSRLHYRHFQDAIDMINAGKLSLEGSVSHTFPFLKAQEAFDFMDSRDPSIRKIALLYD